MVSDPGARRGRGIDAARLGHYQLQGAFWRFAWNFNFRQRPARGGQHRRNRGDKHQR